MTVASGGVVTGALTINGGTADFGGTKQNITSLAGNGGMLSLGAGQLTVNQNGNTNYAGVISGTGGSLVKSGGGALMLSGANTYTGGTTVSGGTLQISGSATLGSASGALTVAGGTLDLGGTMQVQNGGVTIAGGTIQNGTLSSSGGFAVQSGTIGAALSGTGSLSKTTAGTMTLSANNSYSGGTNVAAGILRISGSGTLGAIPETLTVSGGTLDLGATTQTQNGGVTISGGTAANGTLSSSGIFSLKGGVISAALTGSGSVINTGNVTLTGNNTFSGGITVTSGTLTISSDSNLGSGPIALGSGTTIAFAAGGTYTHRITVSGDPAFDVAAGQMVTQTGAISDGAGPGNLAKINGGTLVLSGANTYSGGTVVSAGTLQISGTGTLGSSAGALSVAAGTLDLGGTTQTQNGGITLNGGAIQNGTLSSSAAFALQSGTVSAALAGTGGLNKTTSGTVTLTGANTYTGPTTVSAGTLQGTTTSLHGDIVDNGNVTFNQSSNGAYAGALSGTGSVTVSGGGTVTLSGASSYSGGTTVAAGASLQGTTQSIQGVVVNNGSITFSQSSAGIYSGAISGAGSVAITAGGALVFNGASTYSGPTNVSAGSLLIGDAAHPGAGPGSGTVTVAAGAMLGGHGSIAGSVANSGTVKPGGSIGTLAVGSYAQSNGAILQIEASPTGASKLNVAGTATLGGTLAITYDPGTYGSNVFDILHANSISGTFSAVNGTAPGGFIQSVLYTPTDVELQILPPVPADASLFPALRSAVLLQSQQANGAILGHIAATGTGAGSDTVRTALAYTAPTLVLAAANEYGGILTPQADAGSSGGWFRAVGEFDNVNSNTTISGFHATTGGFVAGYDHAVSNEITAGVAAGYSRTTLTQSGGGTGTVDRPTIAVYGSYNAAPFGLDAMASYAYDHIHAVRPLQFRSGIIRT